MNTCNEKNKLLLIDTNVYEKKKKKINEHKILSEREKFNKSVRILLNKMRIRHGQKLMKYHHKNETDNKNVGIHFFFLIIKTDFNFLASNNLYSCF